MATPVLETKTNTKTNQTTYSIDGKPVDQKAFDAAYQKFYAEPPAPGYTNNGPAVRKTPQTDSRSSQYIPPKLREKPRNILHNFRSFTYNFTLAALPPGQVNMTFNSIDDLANIVLSSKGKGRPTDPAPIPPTESNGPVAYSNDKIRAIQTIEEKLTASLKKDGKSAAEIAQALQPYVAERMKFIAEAAANSKPTTPAFDPARINAARLAYNNSSAGRFDMFIDDVEISSIITPNAITGTSDAFGFSFTVVEPYSIFGFMDALLKSAQDSGYNSYIDCVYVLAIDFSGYPDKTDLPNPIDIPGTRRFFPIRLYEVNTSITERGAIYSCKAVPVSNVAFSVSKGQIKSDTSVTGNTLGEQLNQLMQNLTEQSEAEARTRGSGVWTKYRIEFPLNGGKGVNTRIANAKVEGESVFRSEHSIQQSIEDLINKSGYAKDAVTPGGKGVDTKSTMAYTAKVTSKLEFDSSTERDPNTFSRATIMTYRVNEYKTVASAAVPGHAAAEGDYDALAEVSLRRYDYLFTGKNTDILDFKVDFNLAFYSGITPGMGATDSPNRQSTGKDDGTQPKSDSSATPPPSSKNAQIPSQPTAQSAQSRPNTRITPDAWQQMAYEMYNNMINNASSLYEGEFTILGDPYFLIGGDGNTTGAAQGKVADDGSASAIAGDVLVMLNFYNPIDLDYKTGLMDISVVPMPFSGIFRIWQVVSSFKSGVFKQVLYFTRMNAVPDLTAEYRSPIKEVVNPSQAKLQDSAPPTVTPKTNATGVVVSELSNTVPTPASVVAPKYAGFAPAAPGQPANPITQASMSLAEIKNLSANLQATLANPLAGLQAEVASATASLQGAVAGAAAQITGAINNPINELKSNVNSVQVAANSTVNQIKSPLSSIMRT